MKASKFYLLKDIKGDSDFHRKIGKHNVKGVYFWGFTLNDKALLPVNKNELVIYYIGKDTKSVVRRIMEEVTQLIFGGYGTIIDHDWLKNNPHNAGIYKKQESDNKGTNVLDKEVLYKSDGLHVLYDFFNNTKIQPTIDWMRERLIISWIEVSDKEESVNAIRVSEVCEGQKSALTFRVNDRKSPAIPYGIYTRPLG